MTNNQQKSTMTKREAAKLKTATGRNYNGGEYDDPYYTDDWRPLIKGCLVVAMAVFLIFI